MASKDRILRLKDETRTKILEAAFKIVKEEGWQALSMRRIADAIEYTAPIIYEYFANKEAILLELTRKGFLILADKLEEAKQQHDSPAEQLEAMWLAYWNFAFYKKELYQAMYGVDMNCCDMCAKIPEAEAPALMISEVIKALMTHEPVTEDEVCTKYYTFWSVIHGLISINMVRRGATDKLNREVLKTAISGIIASIK